MKFHFIKLHTLHLHPTRLSSVDFHFLCCVCMQIFFSKTFKTIHSAPNWEWISIQFSSITAANYWSFQRMLNSIYFASILSVKTLVGHFPKGKHSIEKIVEKLTVNKINHIITLMGFIALDTSITATNRLRSPTISILIRNLGNFQI